MKRIILFLLCLGSTSAGFAAPLMTFGWGADGSILKNVNLESGTVVTGDGMVTHAYSSTTPKSPQDLTAYTGIPFYGAFSITNNSGNGTPGFMENFYGLNSLAAGSMRFGVTPAEGSGGVVMRGLVFFEREDLVPQAVGPITFGQGSSVVMERYGTSTQGSVRQGRIAVYALVEDEWSWYLTTSSSTGTITIGDASGQQWRRYSIDSGVAPLHPYDASDPEATLVSGSAFEDISRFGVWFNYAANEGSNTFITIESLTVTATAIPEPGMIALLVGGFALLSVLQMKKN